MRFKFTTALVAAVIASSGFAASDASAGFVPTGVQIDVDRTLVQNTWGWTECFSTAGNSSGTSVSSILSACDGDYLMLATYVTGQSNYDILAAARYEDVTFDTGVQGSNTNGIDTSHTANGSEWYFSDSYSWGFSELGNDIRLWSCDVALSPSYEDNIGMCWHAGSGNLNSGWAYNDGTYTSLYTGGVNRVVLTMNEMQVPEPGTMGILGIGLAGLGFARRRKLAA